MPEASNVSLEIFNITGKRIAVLIESEKQSAGKYKYKFSAQSETSDGIYFYKITVDKNIAVKKIVVVKLFFLKTKI